MKFDLDHTFTKDGNLVLWSIDGSNVVLAYLTQEALEDGIPHGRSLTKAQCFHLADANIDALSRIAAAKFEAGEALRPSMDHRPYVVLARDDLLSSGERFSASILDAQPFGWVSDPR